MMIRLKITQLTILYANKKIAEIFIEENQKRQLHKHITEGLDRIKTFGLHFLIISNDVAYKRLKDESEVV